VTGTPARTRQIRALVVDDGIGSSQRKLLVNALQGDGDISVIQTSTAATHAVECVTSCHPDIVILDLHLHAGESQRSIEQIMAHAPTPILVMSAAGDHDSRSVVRALVAGALEALPRPVEWTATLGADLRRSVRQVSSVRVIRHPHGGKAAPARPVAAGSPRRPVVAIAASTGGPSALAILLAGLAGLQAPVLVVQHLHADFTQGLVEWMSRVSALPVETAAHDVVARAGRVYFAPGGAHLRYVGGGRLELATTPVTLHRPSADELFHSVAHHAGSAGIGVLLTGMGDDGANGMLAMRQRGGHTFGQDQASSAVFGMPNAAARLGAVTALLPLDKLAAAVQRAVREVRA
jgi:two-component system chemotaxis response regulator CheB